jgi:hypothetical protein
MDEIERKWLLKRLPEIVKLKPVKLIKQGYLTVKPEVRIREKWSSYSGYSYKLEVKSDGDLTRKEIPVDLNKDQYEHLKSIIMEPMITKDYYSFVDSRKDDKSDIDLDNMENNKVIEISFVDKGIPSQFIYMEVEFKSEEEAKAYVLPDYIINECEPVEVTYDPEYKMKNYWSRTRLNNTLYRNAH